MKGPAEIVALTRGSLVRLEASAGATPGEYSLPSGLGAELFLALRTGDSIEVDWPEPARESFSSLVLSNLALTEDFFDRRQLLGVFYDKPSQDVYSLLVISREGKTTLTEVRNLPWRLVILRWKYEPNGQRLMLAGRGYFYRGILASGEALPAVRLVSKPWQSGPPGRIVIEP